MGLRLRPELELARGLRRLPAPQARSRAEPRLIQTVRGVGYVLREHSELPAPAGARPAAPPWRSRWCSGCALAVLGRARHAARPARRRAAHPGDDAARVAGRARRSGAAAVPSPARTTLLLSGESPALVRVSRFAGRHVGRRGAAGRRSSATTQDMQQVAQGKRAPFFADRDVAGRTCACSSAAGRRPGDLRRAPADRGRRRARHAALGARAARAGRDRARGRPLAARHARGRPARSPSSRTTAEHVATTRDLTPADRRAAASDELVAPGDLVQHDARGARALSARAAPARRRRLARAAHAAHQPAHEPRGARARRPAGRRTTATGCAATSSPSWRS